MLNTPGCIILSVSTGRGWMQGMQIGEILIAAGAVTAEDVQEALRRQRSAGGLLGDNLVALGLITAPRLDSILTAMPPPPRSLAETGNAEAELLNTLLHTLHARTLPTRSKIAGGERGHAV